GRLHRRRQLALRRLCVVRRHRFIGGGVLHPKHLRGLGRSKLRTQQQGRGGIPVACRIRQRFRVSRSASFPLRHPLARRRREQREGSICVHVSRRVGGCG